MARSSNLPLRRRMPGISNGRPFTKICTAGRRDRFSNKMGDSDNESMAELLEYPLEILGADPFVPDVSVLPQAMISNDSLIMDYPRDTAKTDIAVRALHILQSDGVACRW